MSSSSSNNYVLGQVMLTFPIQQIKSDQIKSNQIKS